MATNKRPKLTPLQAAWNKEIARLKKFQKRAEKRGYIFAPDFIPEKPKRITKKRLAELQARTAKVNYAKAQYVNPSTGEVVSGVQGRKIERGAAARKGWATSRRKKEKRQEQEKGRGPETELPAEQEEPETPERPTEPERPGAPDDAEGHFNVIEQIIQLFGGIPEVKYGGRYQNLIDLETGKQKCVEMLLNEWDERTDKGEGAAYSAYLRAIEATLAGEVNQIIYDDSDQSTVDGHYSYIVFLIQGGYLTMTDMLEIESAYDDTGEEEYN